jgi:periodic tryptophan protein 1
VRKSHDIFKNLANILFFFFFLISLFNFFIISKRIVDKSMFSSLAWVRKGAARELPDKYELTEEEFQRVSQLAGDRLRMPNMDGGEFKASGEEDTDMEMDVEKTQTKTKSNKINGESIAVPDPELAEYDLDNYDDSASDNDDDGEGNGRIYLASLTRNI